MLGETPLLKFIALITFDRDYEKMNARIASLEQEILTLQKKDQELAATLTAADQAINTIKKEITSYELSVKELDGHIKEKKERLAAAMSPREHRAIMSEVDALSARQLRSEENLLAAWSSLETRKRFYDKLLQANEQQMQDIKSSITEKQNQIEHEKSLLAQGDVQRKTYEQGLPAEWLDKYAAMRSRVPNPVVPIQQDSCSACFYCMSQQELVELRRRALIQCKGCYRFLYCPSAHQIT